MLVWRSFDARRTRATTKSGQAERWTTFPTKENRKVRCDAREELKVTMLTSLTLR